MLTVGTDCSGMDLPVVALKRLGVDVNQVFCSDISKCALEVISANKPHNCVVFGDITTRTHEYLKGWRNTLDLYICSPPCKNYSGLNILKRKEDTHLWVHCINAIDYLRPKAFLFENVERFKSKDTHFEQMLERIKDMGCYDVHYKVMNSKDYGIPQNRKRLFVVGLRKDCVRLSFVWPEPIACEVTCMDLIDPTVDADRHRAFPSHIERMQKLGFDFETPGILNLNTTGLQASQYWKRCKQRMPHPARTTIAPTMPSSPPGLFVNHLQRVLTGQECLRFMGVRQGELNFPSTLRESNLRRLCGNAIVVDCVEKVLCQMLRALDVQKMPPCTRLQ